MTPLAASSSASRALLRRGSPAALATQGAARDWLLPVPAAGCRGPRRGPLGGRSALAASWGGGGGWRRRVGCRGCRGDLLRYFVTDTGERQRRRHSGGHQRNSPRGGAPFVSRPSGAALSCQNARYRGNTNSSGWFFIISGLGFARLSDRAVKLGENDWDERRSQTPDLSIASLNAKGEA
jgi:hypothetical protein